MKDSFRLYIRLWMVISGAFLTLTVVFGSVLKVGYEQNLELWSSAQAQDKSGHSVKLVIYADPALEHKDKIRPTIFNLSPKDGKVGYGVFHNRLEGSINVIENGTFDVLSYPKLENRGQGSYPGTRVNSWPAMHDYVVKTVEYNSWTEEYRDDNGIKRRKPFHSVVIVLSSNVAGLDNDVTIFATDSEGVEPKGYWIILDMKNGKKLFDYIDAGTKFIIAIEQPDPS